jgi:hypothetical protein
VCRLSFTKNEHIIEFENRKKSERERAKEKEREGQ